MTVVQETELLRGSRAAALPSRIDGRVNLYWVFGRSGKHGVYNLKHNDLQFDVAKSDHIGKRILLRD